MSLDAHLASVVHSNAALVEHKTANVDGQLGVAAQAPIVTDVFKRAADLAKELGGAAKPSGAGGGDIGVAMFATPETARLFARALLDDADPERSGLFHA